METVGRNDNLGSSGRGRGRGCGCGAGRKIH